MPSITTHYFFGKEMARRFSAFLPDEPCRQAFLLGNQGPDPLFFCFTSPQSKRIRSMGFWIHDRHCIATLKELLRPWDGENPSLIRSYQMGFLCHYALDRNAHPYVYQTEPKLLLSGAVREDYRFTHAKVESNLDVILLHRMGSSARAFNPAKILPKSAMIDEAIGTYYHRFARKGYHWDVPTQEIIRAFSDMRFIERLLHSRLGIKRNVVSQFDGFALGDSYYRAMSLNDTDYQAFDYANAKREPWTNRQGNEVTWDFFELFQHTLADAAELLWNWLDRMPIDRLTECYNFKGEKAPNLRCRALL